MNQILNPPNSYDFGLSFNYDVWLAGSTVTLSNVPWDSMYRDVVEFDERHKLDVFLDSNSHKIPVNNLFHIKPNNPVVRLDVPYNEALKYNYLRVSNQAQPIPGDTSKSFYYFVRDVNYVAPNTTEFVIQLDVWQTFIYDVKLKSGYLERGHYAVQRGQQYPNWQFFEVPESIDMGSTYVTGSPELTIDLINQNSNVAVTSSIDLETPPGSVTAPVLNSARGGFMQFARQSAKTYTLTGTEIANYISVMRPYPWITQGIFRMCMYPSWVGVGTPVNQTSGYPQYLRGGDVAVANFQNKNIGTLTNFREVIKTAFKRRYGNSDMNWALDRFGKLYSAPYSFIEFTTQQGNTVDLDPLKIIGENLDIQASVSIFPGDERINVFTKPGQYATDVSEQNILAVTELPTLSLVNDQATVALASQARSLQQARSSAAWAQERALAGNANSFDNANIGIQMAGDLASISRNSDAASVGISNDLARNSAMLNAATGIVGGAVGGAPAGPAGVAAGIGISAGSAVASGIGVGMGIDAANQQLAVRQNANISGQNVSGGAAGRIADNNKALGDWASKGDYANTIASIDAKVQDTKMTPPSVIGSTGSTMSHFAMYGGLKLIARIKHIDIDALSRLVQYWSRYGYSFHKFMNIETLKCMSTFTYWKLTEVYIDSSGLTAPEGVLNTLRGIFEKGVTVWHDVERIGTYDFERNTPIV